MGAVHQLLLELGKEEAKRTEINRPVLEAAAAYLASEETRTSISLLGMGTSRPAAPPSGRRRPLAGEK